jgi:hypothetical protein
VERLDWFNGFEKGQFSEFVDGYHQRHSTDALRQVPQLVRSTAWNEKVHSLASNTVSQSTKIISISLFLQQETNWILIEQLYLYPTPHPSDRQSQVDFEHPDIEKFPHFGDVLAIEVLSFPFFLSFFSLTQ